MANKIKEKLQNYKVEFNRELFDSYTQHLKKSNTQVGEAILIDEKEAKKDPAYKIIRHKKGFQSFLEYLPDRVSKTIILKNKVYARLPIPQLISKFPLDVEAGEKRAWLEISNQYFRKTVIYDLVATYSRVIFVRKLDCKKKAYGVKTRNIDAFIKRNSWIKKKYKHLIQSNVEYDCYDKIINDLFSFEGLNKFQFSYTDKRNPYDLQPASIKNIVHNK